MTYVDSSGKCSVPTGLQKGQVGICIEAFIASKRVPGHEVGLGDGRAFNGNNPGLTSKIQVQIILAADNNGVYRSDPVTRIGMSRFQVATANEGGFDAAKNGDMRSNGQVALPGKGGASVGSFETTRPAGASDFGITTLNITGTAKNGVQALGDTLSSLPIPASVAAGEIMKAQVPGTIDFSINFKITGNGNVEWNGALVKGYPSYAAYSYTIDENNNVQTNRIREIPEGTIDELTKPMKKIP